MKKIARLKIIKTNWKMITKTNKEKHVHTYFNVSCPLYCTIHTVLVHKKVGNSIYLCTLLCTFSISKIHTKAESHEARLGEGLGEGLDVSYIHSSNDKSKETRFFFLFFSW